MTNKYLIQKGFVAQKMNNRIIIFDGEKSVLHSFNQTATFIFEKIKRGIDNKKLAELIAKKYSISEKKAEQDILEFIEELKSKKIIYFKR